MRRGWIIGLAIGALLSLGLGVALALLPATPTWTLWQITRALDRRDVDALSELIDFPKVAASAMGELQDEANDHGLSDLGRLALSLLSGARLRTIFDDPDRPLDVTPADFLAAWWSMEREGDRATLHLKAGGDTFDLILEQQGHERGWRIVGVRPLRALFRIEEKHPEKSRSALLSPRASPASPR
jgi:hypothetical protein